MYSPKKQQARDSGKLRHLKLTVYTWELGEMNRPKSGKTHVQIIPKASNHTGLISEGLPLDGNEVKVTQLCLTFGDPMDYTVHGSLQARILEWVAIPFSRGSSQLRDQTQVSHIAGGFFTSWTTEEALEPVYKDREMYFFQIPNF